jgi:hypothetical protein
MHNVYSPQQENTGHDEKALHCTSILLAQNMKQLIKFKSIGRKSTFYLPIGSMYAIYGNVYHQYPPVMLALIYQHHGFVMG